MIGDEFECDERPNDYYIRDAAQSNFKVTSFLTDEYTGMIPLFEKLHREIPKSHPSHETLEKMTNRLLQVLTQVNYTGRCLGGYLNPNAAKHVDIRPTLRQIIRELKAAEKHAEYWSDHEVKK